MSTSASEFELSPEYDGLRRAAEELAREVEPLAVEADAKSVRDERIWKLLGDSGLCAVAVPARWGGLHEDVDPVAVCVVREVFMATSAHLDSLFALQGIGSYALARGGTDAERDRWLPGVASGETMAALALTEPEAGSDLRSLTTTLEDGGPGLRLSGEKSYISNAGAADFYAVLAREGTGFSAVVVDAAAEGISVVPTPEIIAPHILGEVTFEDVPIAEEARIGTAGTGFDHVLATLAVFRVSVAAASVGLAQAALDEAVRHTTTREQFGKPLARHGQVAAMLADSWTEIESARLLTYRAAARARRDPVAAIAHSSMAKLAASETAGRVVDRAVQLMGRFGLVRDSKIERLYREARPMRIYEGSSEVLRLAVAKDLTTKGNK